MGFTLWLQPQQVELGPYPAKKGYPKKCWVFVRENPDFSVGFSMGKSANLSHGELGTPIFLAGNLQMAMQLLNAQLQEDEFAPMGAICGSKPQTKRLAFSRRVV